MEICSQPFKRVQKRSINCVLSSFDYFLKMKPYGKCLKWSLKRLLFKPRKTDWKHQKTLKIAPPHENWSNFDHKPLKKCFSSKTVKVNPIPVCESDLMVWSRISLHDFFFFLTNPILGYKLQIHPSTSEAYWGWFSYTYHSVSHKVLWA